MNEKLRNAPTPTLGYRHSGLDTELFGRTDCPQLKFRNSNFGSAFVGVQPSDGKVQTKLWHQKCFECSGRNKTTVAWPSRTSNEKNWPNEKMFSTKKLQFVKKPVWLTPAQLIQVRERWKTVRKRRLSHTGCVFDHIIYNWEIKIGKNKKTFLYLVYF